MPPPEVLPVHGLTLREVARRYRVSRNRVRVWIGRGELRAINTSDATSSRPRYLVMPDALVAFERGRDAAGPPPLPRRRQKASGFVDYFPDQK